MNASKQRSISVILSYVSMAMGFVIAMFYTPYALSHMGQAEYGTYHFVSSIVSYLSLLTCGFGSAYMKFATPYRMKGDKEGEANINGLFLMLFLIMGSIALIIGGIMSWQSDWILGGKLSTEELETGKVLMIILVINLFLSFPVSIFNSYVIAEEQFVFQKGIALCGAVMNPLLSIVVLSWGYKSIGVALVSLFLTLVVNTTTICFCIFKLKMRFHIKLENMKQAKEVFIFSSYLLLSMIVDQVNWSVDKFLLGKLCGTIAVSIYNLGSTINTYYKSAGDAISNVYVPKVYKVLSSENGDFEATRLMVQIGRIQAMMLFLVMSGFIIYGKAFINLWVGQEYEAAYYVVLLLIIPVTIPELQKIGLEIQKAKNMHQFRSILYAIIAGVNLLISIPLAKHFGAVGSALGTAITVLCGNGLIMNIYYHKKVHMNMIYFWKHMLKLVPPVLIVVCIGIGLQYIIHPTTWPLFILSVAIYTILYLLSILLFGLNAEEKHIVHRLVNKIRR